MTLTSVTDDSPYFSLETEFLNTIVDGESAMKDFGKRLTKLQESSVQNLSPCSPSTAAVAYRTASSISIISSSFMEMESISKDIENDLFTDVTDILQHLTIQEFELLSDANSPRCTQGHGLRGPSDTVGDTSTQYSAPLRWLMNHLDNPYPSASVKISLCKRSGLSLKAIGEWFSQTRRRIGWTSISKQHFKGDRQLTRDCVNRVLFEPSGKLCYAPEVVQDVEDMRMAADRLYSKKFDRNRSTMIADSYFIKPPCVNDGGNASSETPPLKFRGILLPQHGDTTSTPNFHSATVGLGSEPQIAGQIWNSTKRKRSFDASTIENNFLQIDNAAERSRSMKRLKNLEPSDLRTVACAASLSAISSRESTMEPQTLSRVLSDDDCQQDCPSIGHQNHCIVSSQRPLKRMREFSPTVSCPLSRTASLSTTVSSRASTAELSTPGTQILPLPTLDIEDSIDKWISSLSSDFTEDQSDGVQLSKRRLISDSDSCLSAKRIRLSEKDISWPETVSDLIHDPSSNESDPLAVYQQFDFNLPPSASVGANLIVGEPLHINVFDCARWGFSDPDEVYMSKSDIECMGIVKDNVTYPATDIRGDMTTGLANDTEVIERMSAQVKDYTHDVDLPALEGLISGPTAIPGTATSSSPSPSVNALDGSLEWLMKLTRINYLLAEAAHLQSEVFG